MSINERRKTAKEMLRKWNGPAERLFALRRPFLKIFSCLLGVAPDLI